VNAFVQYEQACGLCCVEPAACRICIRNCASPANTQRVSLGAGMNVTTCGAHAIAGAFISRYIHFDTIILNKNIRWLQAFCYIFV